MAQISLPKDIADLALAFMRSVYAARLYGSGHTLLKKNIQRLFTAFKGATASRDFLFIGCAKDAFFLEGAFYQVKDAHLQKFLKFFHSLGISHILLDKATDAEELESFIGLLAGARRGQGRDVLSALPREKVKHVRLGLLDYTIFSTVEAVAAQLAQSSEEETIWRQLIVQPAAAGTFHLGPDKIKELVRLSGDLDQLKGLLLKMDTEMAERQQGVSPAQRGALLANFIHNLGDTLAQIDPENRKQFARQVSALFDSLEPQLKMPILGGVPPCSTGEENKGVTHDIFQALPDGQLVHLLVDALRETGLNSTTFRNLFERALAKYKEPAVLLSLIRQEMHQATQERRPGALNHWQQLEQLLVQQQETRKLDEQYRQEIDALAASIQMQVPLVEEEEMTRLIKTLTPGSLRAAKARLILDLIGQPPAPQGDAFLPHLLEGLGEIVRHLLQQGEFRNVGNLLCEVLLAFSDHPQKASIKKTVNSMVSTEEIQELLKDLLKDCHTYEPEETSEVGAICQLYPEKASAFLLDMLIGLEDEENPQAGWLMTVLASLGSRITRILGQRLQDAPEHAIPRLLNLAAISDDRYLSTVVEQLVEHPNGEVRLKAVSTLGTLKAERAVPRLTQIVLQKSWVKTRKIKSLQLVAARALAQIGTQQAREVLREVVSHGSGELKALCQDLV